MFGAASSLADAAGGLSDLAAQIFPVGVPVDAQANLLDRGICLRCAGQKDGMTGFWKA